MENKNTTKNPHWGKAGNLWESVEKVHNPQHHRVLRSQIFPFLRPILEAAGSYQSQLSMGK